MTRRPSALSERSMKLAEESSSAERMGASRESGDGGWRRPAATGEARRRWRRCRRSISELDFEVVDQGPRDLGFTFSDADLASIVPGLRHKRSEENHRATASAPAPAPSPAPPPPPRIQSTATAPALFLHQSSQRQTGGKSANTSSRGRETC